MKKGKPSAWDLLAVNGLLRALWKVKMLMNEAELELADLITDPDLDSDEAKMDKMVRDLRAMQKKIHAIRMRIRQRVIR